MIRSPLRHVAGFFRTVGFLLAAEVVWASPAQGSATHVLMWDAPKDVAAGTGKIRAQFVPDHIGFRSRVLQQTARSGLLRHDPEVKALAGTAILRVDGDEAAARAWLSGLKSAGKTQAIVLPKRLRQPHAFPTDPLCAPSPLRPDYMWHLKNTGAYGSVAGMDLRVETAWNVWRGRGVRVGVIDNGLQLTHPEFAGAVDTAYGYDFNDEDADPSPVKPSDRHGTPCSGLIGGRADNGVGGCGVAPECRLSMLRLLSAPADDFDEAAAFSWRNDAIDVKSNSWGPNEGDGRLDGPGPLARAALADAVTNGRGGKGTVFVFSAGNGGPLDDANANGYGNSPFVMTVAALDHLGVRSDYSEAGANVLVCAPSSGTRGLTAPDLLGVAGYNDALYPTDYADAGETLAFGGTSAACAETAGVVALMLEANPALGWRDVQEILIRTARKVDSADGGWRTNAAGFSFNDQYGAGLVDATAACQMAVGWANLAPVQLASGASSGPPLAIPDQGTWIEREIVVPSPQNLRCEHVVLRVLATHPWRGQLEIELVSPSGTVSHMLHPVIDHRANLDWSPSTVQAWGEAGGGRWTVRVRDTVAGLAGTLDSAELHVYGTPIAASNAPILIGPVTATGETRTPFTFFLTADGTPDAFTAVGLPSGVTLEPDTGKISGEVAQPGVWNVAVGATNAFGASGGMLQLTFTWSFADRVGNALDLAAPRWQWSGNAPVLLDGVAAHDGNDAVRLESPVRGGSNTLFTDVAGPAVLSWRWKLGAGDDGDSAALEIDGQRVERLDGLTGWESGRIALFPGNHRLTWKVNRSVVSAGCSLDIDEITLDSLPSNAPALVWPPMPTGTVAGFAAVFSAPSAGHGALHFAWEKNGTAVVPGVDQDRLILNAASLLDGGDYRVTVTDNVGFVQGDAVSLTVAPSTDGSLALAMDSVGTPWVTSVPGWIAGTDVTHDGIDAAKAATGNSGEQRWIWTSVTGPGALRFWWRLDSPVGDLVCHVDGKPVRTASAGTGWQPVLLRLDGGPHSVGWRLRQTAAGAATAWLDGAQFTFNGYPDWAEAHFSPSQMADAAVSGEAGDPDADGVDNFLEFAFALDPLGGNRFADVVQIAVADEIDGRHLIVTYRERIDAAARGLVATLWIANGPDGDDWLPFETAATGLPTGSDGVTQAVVRRSVAPVPAGWSRCLARLRVGQK